jgi:hypothetical protein
MKTWGLSVSLVVVKYKSLFLIDDILAKTVRTTQKIRVQTRPWIESHIATRPSVQSRGTELISHTYLYISLHMT